MIKFDKPTNLNGAELLIELEQANVIVTGLPFDDAANGLWLDIAEKDAAKAATVVAEHNGTIIAPEATIEDKLASVGLNFTSLKNALGL